MTTLTDQRVEQFVGLLAEHDLRLRQLIAATVRHAGDADEVRQEIYAALWRGYDRFEPGTDFGKWSMAVARYQVLAYLERKRRDRLVFSPEFIEHVAEQVERLPRDDGDRRTALRKCLEFLGASSREVIEQFYYRAKRAGEIAASLGMTPAAVYQILSRSRSQLHNCIERRLGGEEGGENV